jgi:hypothetical protein
MIDQLNIESRNLVKVAFQIAMRSESAVSYETAMRISAVERDIVVELINEKAEAEKAALRKSTSKSRAKR